MTLRRHRPRMESQTYVALRFKSNMVGWRTNLLGSKLKKYGLRQQCSGRSSLSLWCLLISVLECCYLKCWVFNWVIGTSAIGSFGKSLGIWLCSKKALRMMASSLSKAKGCWRIANTIFLSPSCQAQLKSLRLYVQKLRPWKVESKIWGQKYTAPGFCRSRSRELLLSLALCPRAFAVPPPSLRALTHWQTQWHRYTNAITTTNMYKEKKKKSGLEERTQSEHRPQADLSLKVRGCSVWLSCKSLL